MIFNGLKLSVMQLPVRIRLSQITETLQASRRGLGVAALICLMAAPSSIAADRARFLELIHQADTARNGGRLQEAEQMYAAAVKEDPASPVGHNQLGLCYERENRLLEAAGQFNAALASNPDFVPSLQNLGSVMYRQGRYNEAIEKYEKVMLLKKTPDAEAETNLAIVLRDRATFAGGKTRDQDFENAIQHFRKAIQIDPNFPQAHNNLGLCYLHLRRFSEAETEIRQAIELKRDYAIAYFNLGLVEQARHNNQAAVAAFQTSLKYETVPMYKEGTRRKIKELGIATETEDHFLHGFDLLVQRHWHEAEDELRKAVEGPESANAIAWNNLGVALFNQEKFPEAIKAYATANKLKARFSAAEYNLGQALRSSGDKKGAQESFLQALRDAHGTHALAHNALAIMLREQGDIKGATSHYRLAVMQSGDTLPVVHFNLGLLYAADPLKHKDAVEEFKRYVAQAPDGLNAESARSEIQRLSKQ
jgi:superkiller protein 3